MKPDGLRQVDPPQRVEREIGSAPLLGHVGRVFDQNPQKGNRHKARRLTRKKAKPQTEKQRLVIRAWSLAFAVIVLLVIVGMVWLRLASDVRQAAVANAKTDHSGNGARTVSRLPSPSKDVALDLVKRALLNRDPVKVPEFFRIGSATPAELVGFLEHTVTTEGAVTSYEWLSSMDANGLLIDGVLVNTRNGDQKHNRLALLTPDDKGRWRIDFDAFARTVTPSWGEILSGSARQGVVRVLFVKDNYYNGPFADESQWACYRMGSPDLKDNNDLLGYCRKDSPQAAAMKLIMVKATRGSRKMGLFRALLEIRHIEGAGARQFEISRVLAEDWVRSTEPFDKSPD